jgi:hypothetical protein
MSTGFRLLMLSAMYENGGNTTHRFLDGHPQLYVYPFESQIGTRHVNDALTSLFPVKYRWPVFPLDGTPAQDYHAIIDEEYKVRTRTPNVSKFRDCDLAGSDDDRREHYLAHINRTGRSTAANVEAFFRATFESWSNYRRTGSETMWVGYSPIIVVDAEKILQALPAAHVLHVVRNPWSAYADTKKRPVPLPLSSYLLSWTLNQYSALVAKARFPDRLHIIRLEDTLEDPANVLGDFCERLGLSRSASLGQPTWNGTSLPQVYPWGTIRQATGAANRATAAELSKEERAEVAMRAEPYLDVFNYRNFLGRI